MSVAGAWEEVKRGPEGKYGHRTGDPGSVPPFMAKLASKGQTPEQQAEAWRSFWP